MDGTIRIKIMKLTGMIIAAYIPNPLIGLISENALARNATAVVLDVTVMARNERLKAKASLRLSSFLMKCKNSDWRQASQKTKMSSAAIPSTIKIVSWLSVVTSVI